MSNVSSEPATNVVSAIDTGKTLAAQPSPIERKRRWSIDVVQGASSVDSPTKYRVFTSASPIDRAFGVNTVVKEAKIRELERVIKLGFETGSSEFQKCLSAIDKLFLLCECPELAEMFGKLGEKELTLAAKQQVLLQFVGSLFANTEEEERLALEQSQRVLFVCVMVLKYYENLTAFFRVLLVADGNLFHNLFKKVSWDRFAIVVYGHALRASTIDVDAFRAFKIDTAQYNGPEYLFACFKEMRTAATDNGIEDALRTQGSTTMLFVCRSLTFFGSNAWDDYEISRSVVQVNRLLAKCSAPPLLAGGDTENLPFSLVPAPMADLVRGDKVALSIQSHMAAISLKAETEEQKNVLWAWFDSYEKSHYVSVWQIGSVTRLAIDSARTSVVTRLFNSANVRDTFMLGVFLNFVQEKIENESTSPAVKMTWSCVLRRDRKSVV